MGIEDVHLHQVLDAGADISLKGPKSKTAMDVAKLRKDDDALKLLREAQADDKAFAKAKSGETGRSYADYLVAQPTGRHADDAAFARAEWVGTGSAYRAYLALYPEGKHKAVARAKATAADPDIEPKCEDLPGKYLEGNHAECWQEITRLPGCYHWTYHYHSDRPSKNWSGRCPGGVVQGQGALFMSSGSNHTRYRATGKYERGKRQDHWVFRRDDRWLYEGPYDKGKSHGRWSIRVGDKGVKGVHKGPLVDGKRHGSWVHRQDDGTVGKGEYVDGKQHGPWTYRWHSGGCSVLEFNAGEETGRRDC